MGQTLNWGRHYLQVEPSHFRVDYQINPFMDLADQPDPALAYLQWLRLVETIESLGARVDVLKQRADAPDMVYAMNLGLGIQSEAGEQHVALSHMRYAERRMETQSAAAFFAAQGWTTSRFGQDGVGAHFEAGDAFAWRGDLVVGYGPRTEELGLKHLATELGVRVRGFRIAHPGMYHMDLAFCPLDEDRALVCPAAFDADSAAALLELIPEPLILTEEEALTTFAANSIVIGRTVLMPACPEHLRERLVAWGFEVRIVDVSQFHKGGGSIRCLTNPVDVRVDRDLESMPGGEVVLPRSRG